MHLLNSGNPPPCDDSDHAGQWPERVDLSRRMDFGRMTVFGAQRKHVTLPTDFRSPSVNGHSCYGHLTARFAP